MAAHFIVKPLKTFNHKPELTRKTRKLSGYGKANNRFMRYDHLEKPSQERLNLIRKNHA